MSLTLSGTNGVVGAGFTLDASGASVTAGVGTFSSIRGEHHGDGANLTGLPAAQLTGALPALSAASLTSIPAANLVGVCTSGLTKTGGFGKLVQVVTSYYASQHSTTSSSAQDTGHTLVITPTSNDNKIIIMNQTSGGNSASGRSWKHWLRYTIGGSESGATYMQLGDSSQNSSFAFSHVLYWVHTSPGTAEITYKTQHSTDGSGTAYYGYSGSYMVAWEVSS
jgi:hypothetical protein